MGCCWPDFPVEVSTMKPGRLFVSAPSPYQTHDPIDGRPEMVVPVFMKVCAGSWLIASVTIERTMQISSAMEPKFGNSSQICWPDLPNFLNPHCGARHLSDCPCNCAIGWPLVNDSGIGLPDISA